MIELYFVFYNVSIFPYKKIIIFFYIYIYIAQLSLLKTIDYIIDKSKRIKNKERVNSNSSKGKKVSHPNNKAKLMDEAYGVKRPIT